MNLGQVLGGVAVAGTVVLFGLAVTEDDDPESITAGPSVVLAPTDASVTTDTSVAPSAIPTTDAVATTEVIATTEPAADTQPTTGRTTEPTDPPSTTDAPATTTRATTTVAPTSPTNPAPSTTVATLPESRRPTVAVRVVNAGADAGAARFVSGVLQEAGFEPLAPQDAADNVGGTIILHAPGRESEAAAVNAVIQTDRVIAAPAGDPNWDAFGGEADVLVLLGRR